MNSRPADQVINILEGHNFSVCDCIGARSCFDIFAKREKIFLIKILMNIEGFTKESAVQLKLAAFSLSAVPMIIAKRMKNANLRDGVIYTRYNINAFTPRTLEIMLEENTPLIYSVRGDYVVDVGCELLKNLRSDVKMTMQDLADELKISKQSIYRYEHTGIIPLNIVSKIVEFFNNFDESDIEFKNPIFDREIEIEIEGSGIKKQDDDDAANKQEPAHGNLSDLMKEVINEFKNMGCSTTQVNAPFDILVKGEKQNEELIFTVVSKDPRTIKKKIKIVTEISDMAKGYKVCVSEKRQNIDIVFIRPDELKEIHNSRELIKLLLES